MQIKSSLQIQLVTLNAAEIVAAERCYHPLNHNIKCCNTSCSRDPNFFDPTLQSIILGGMGAQPKNDVATIAR